MTSGKIQEPSITHQGERVKITIKEAIGSLLTDLTQLMTSGKIQDPSITLQGERVKITIGKLLELRSCTKQ